MQMHPKKRLEIFIEAPLMRRIAERLDRAGVTGYSILPVIAGAGRGGAWSTDGQVSDATRQLAIVCILDAARLPDVLESVYEVVSHQIGLVAVSDVEVVRPARF